MGEIVRAAGTALAGIFCGMTLAEAAIIIPGGRRAGVRAGLEAFREMGKLGWKIAPPIGVSPFFIMIAAALIGDGSGGNTAVTVVGLAFYGVGAPISFLLYKPADAALFELGEDADEDEFRQRLDRVWRTVTARSVFYLAGFFLFVAALFV